MNTDKLLNQKKGISPIIATLLLILIAIAAGVIVYAYVVGFIGASTSNSGGTTNTLSMDQVSVTSKASTYPVTAYVRNEGPTTESFNSGFFVKASTLNDQLAPAISLSSTVATSIKNLTIQQTVSSSQLTVSVACQAAAGVITVSMFGVAGAGTITCAVTLTSTTITVPSLTFTNSPTNGNLVDFETNTGFAISTNANAPTIVAVALASGATINEAVNQVGQFTLSVPIANMSTSASVLALSAGTTYTVQVTGTDGASTTASAKAN